MLIKKDVIVVGSGVAGLSFAIRIAELLPEKEVLVISKTKLSISNTHFAQGGIATVTDLEKDSFAAHIEDTMNSGEHLSNPEIVKLVVETAPQRIQELVEYDMPFTRNEEGNFDLGLEGGHSANRVLHAFDNTGEYLADTLINKARTIQNISFKEFVFCKDLLVNEEKEVCGISAFDTDSKEFLEFQGKYVILATGGSGQVYKNTTNPEVATGDGVVMALDAGASAKNMNYVQFHPTVLYEKDKIQLDLLTEAIRGFGGHIVNSKGERFVFNSDVRGELATRDIVSSAIFEELKKSGEDCVYLDCRHLGLEAFTNKFPKITENLQSKNIHIEKDLIPIVPAAHYQCGGIVVDEKGFTGINGLFAIGECAETGLHGANRLASNSLLEGLVFGHESADYIAARFEEEKRTFVSDKNHLEYAEDNDESYQKIITQLRNSMSRNATIVSTLDDLLKQKEIIEDLVNEFNKNNKENVFSIKKQTTYNLLSIAQEIVFSKIELVKEKVVTH